LPAADHQAVDIDAVSAFSPKRIPPSIGPSHSTSASDSGRRRSLHIRFTN